MPPTRPTAPRDRFTVPAPRCYLAEVSYEGAPHVHVTATVEALTQILGDGIQAAHYTGHSVTVNLLARYDAGKLTPLTLRSLGTDSDRGDDWLDWRYELRTADADGSLVADFLVCIDGRA